MLDLKDVTAPALKNDVFPGCAPAPLSCAPDGELYYEKVTENKEARFNYDKNAFCSPDLCNPDYDSRYCSPDDVCAPAYSACNPDY